MKKSATILALFAATLFTVSCLRETEIVSEKAIPEGYYEEILTVVYPESDTRTSFDNTTGTFSWSEGDQIAFHLSDGTYTTAPINPQTGSVRLVIREGVTRDEFAVYPASSAVSDHAEKEDMQLTLPDTYDISEDLVSEYAPTTMLAVQETGSNTLQFNHAGGIIQLNLQVPAHTKTIKVEFMNKVVTGTIPVSENNDYYTLDLDAPENNIEGGNVITFIVSNDENGLEEVTPVRVNIPVPSGRYNVIKYTYNDGTWDTYEYQKDYAFTLKRSGGKRLSPSPEDFVDAMNYFHFIALEDNCTVTFNCPYSVMYYSTDNKQTWNPYTSETTLNLEHEGDVVWFYNTNGVLNKKAAAKTVRFSGTGTLKVAGILATLKNKTFDTNRTYTQTNVKTEIDVYAGLFEYMTSLVDAGELIVGGDYNQYEEGFMSMFSSCTALTSAPELPATNLAPWCYSNMFSWCTALTSAPELPATNMLQGCYSSMFYNCSALTSAPELPATNLASGCYASMFSNCKSITTAPELPATIMEPVCYRYMFSGCTALTSAPELPSVTLAQECYMSMFDCCYALTSAPELPATVMKKSCYAYMFNACKSLSTPPELPATILADNCYDNMFSMCSSLTTPPELPAMELATNCYKEMFHFCSSLSVAPELPSTALAPGCYYNMFNSCYALTVAPELPATTLAEGCYSSMFSCCTNLTATPELPATTLANSCYHNMFSYCRALTTAPRILPATSLAESCYSYMFEECSALMTTPELPATTLEQNCYYHMFYNCSSLTKVTCLAIDMSATNCLTNWLHRVASSGSFYRNIGATDWTTGENGIPSNWTVYTIEDVTPQI